MRTVHFVSIIWAHVISLRTGFLVGIILPTSILPNNRFWYLIIRASLLQDILLSLNSSPQNNYIEQSVAMTADFANYYYSDIF